MISRGLDKNEQPDVTCDTKLLARYQRVLRRLRFRRYLPWTPFQFGARWHKFGAEPKALTPLLSEFERTWGISLPRLYRSFLETVGNGFGGPYYGISPLDEWCAPGNQSDLPGNFLCTPFSPDAPRTSGLVPGAMRICNVGCEHYYLLVVSGRHTGEVWHDGEVDGLGVRKVELPGRETASLAEWLETWLDWVSVGKGESVLVPDKFWTNAHYSGHAAAKVLTDRDLDVAGPVTIAAYQLPCPACVQLLRTEGVERFIVPAVAQPRRRNPKVVAQAAAQNTCKAIPERVYP
jgi:hypothetical protein